MAKGRRPRFAEIVPAQVTVPGPVPAATTFIRAVRRGRFRPTRFRSFDIAAIKAVLTSIFVSGSGGSGSSVGSGGSASSGDTSGSARSDEGRGGI
jgi:hypothetical protein